MTPNTPASPLGWRDRWILTATILASAMAFIDGTAVNTALPVMQRELGADLAAMQWVVEAYLLFLSALIMVGGALGDRFGRRRVFLLGTGLFTAASLWCGLSPATDHLILARAVQGVGGALLIPGSLALLRSAIAEERRGRAIGWWSAFSALTTALGQVLGGYLAEAVTWRAIFIINVPLGLVVVALTLWQVPESRDPEATAPVDWTGAIAAVLGLGGLTYGLLNAAAIGWGDWRVWLPLAVGVAAIVAFVAIEQRSSAPMMPLGVWKNRVFAGTNALTLLLYAALGGALFFLPFNLIQVQGYSATMAGFATLPFVLLLATLSGTMGALADRIGPRIPLVLGPALAGVGFALLAVPGIGGSYWTTFFPGLVVLGLGMAVTVAPLTTTVMNALSERQAGLASGINNAVARTGGLLAIAALGILLAERFEATLATGLADMPLGAAALAALEAEQHKLAAAAAPPGLSPEQAIAVESAIDVAYVIAFRWVMLVCAVLAFASSAIAAITLERRGEPG